ncbi:MAG: type III glutamate--ammonia ligase [Cyanobacteriota bacterium]|nr:type III glutamate--ammonia ligase [Cyanobacteriota bacterium]
MTTADPTAADLSALAAERGLRFFLFSFTDLFGVQRAKLVPAGAATGLAEEGAGFAGFAAWLDLTPADADVLARPDPASLMALPWQPEVGWLATDLLLAGEPLEQAPRGLLRRQIARAAALGLELRSGVEPEFFLLDPERPQVADRLDASAKPCYEQQALMRRYPLISELLSAMEGLGWGPYQADHEDANGQFELNWTYAEALVTADRHAFFRAMAASLAERHGLRASFDPKPIAGLTGNGAHLHLSLWDGQGLNRFDDPAAPLGISALAEQFVAGLLDHAPALCALTNPQPSSYRRLGRSRCASGATWSPAVISWSGNNRSHMIRVPGRGRLELRLGDGAADPYLLQAAVLAAGLDGIERRLSPPPPLFTNTYTDPPSPQQAPPLPDQLGAALAAFAADGRLRQALGEGFCLAYERRLTVRLEGAEPEGAELSQRSQA